MLKFLNNTEWLSPLFDGRSSSQFEPDIAYCYRVVGSNIRPTVDRDMKIFLASVATKT